jgi:hypothetical protein
VKYAWVVGTHGYGYTVWKDRKHWFDVNLDYSSIITPSMVATEIKKNLDK